MRMELILQGGDVWDVIDPSTEGVLKPTTPGQQLDDWVRKDKKALTQIKCYVSDTACHARRRRGSGCGKAWSDTRAELAYDCVEGSMYVIGARTATVSRTLART